MSQRFVLRIIHPQDRGDDVIDRSNTQEDAEIGCLFIDRTSLEVSPSQPDEEEHFQTQRIDHVDPIKSCGLFRFEQEETQQRHSDGQDGSKDIIERIFHNSGIRWLVEWEA